MPRYRVHLEAPDSVPLQDDGTPHFREVVLAVDNPEAAQAYCDGKETEYVAFALSADELQDILDRKARLEEDGGGLSGRDKGLLATHLQDAPYVVTSVEEL